MGGRFARLVPGLGLAALALTACSGGAAAPQPDSPATSAPSASSGFIVRQGDRLVRDGKPFRFAGANAYDLAYDPDHNFGCGTPTKDAAARLAGYPAGSVVRIWAFSSFAASNTGHGQDWGPLDAAVAAAGRHGIALILTLSDQQGQCEDKAYKDHAWYAGGYRGAYLDWLRTIVTRYRDDPAVAAWEPVNEPEPSNCDPGAADCAQHHSCPPDSVSVLRAFFDTVGADLHRWDPHHLVAAGTMGDDQCGVKGTGFATVAASPGLDVLTVHNDDDPGQDSWVQQRAAEARQLGKPLVYEELGLKAGPGCALTTAQRATRLDVAMHAFLALPGAAGALVWNDEPGPAACDYAVAPGDPLRAGIASEENSLR